MDGQLVISKDSILRLKLFYNKDALALASIQQQFEGNKDFFIFQHINKYITLEDGVTVANVLKALEPWADILSSMYDVNIKSYIDFIKKPSFARNAYDWIGIQKIYEVGRDIEFIRDEDSSDKRYMQTKVKKELNTFSMEEKYTVSAYKKNDPEHYCIGSNLHAIKNIPLIISDINILTVFNMSEQPIINPSLKGFQEQGNVGYLVGNNQLTLNELLNALFQYGFYARTPEDGEKMDEYIINSLVNGEGSDGEGDNCERKGSQYESLKERGIREAKQWDDLVELSKSSKYPSKSDEIKETKIDTYRLYNLTIEKPIN